MKSAVQTSNRAWLLLVVLASVLCSSLARAKDPQPIAFKYDPFPPIPTVVVEENAFAASLVETCQILTTSSVPARSEPVDCKGVAAGAAPKTLAEQVAAVEKLMAAQDELAPGDAAASARVTGACSVARASVEAIVVRIDDLQRVCRGLRAAPPS